MAGQTKGWVPDLQVVGREQWRSHVEITCLQLPSLRRPPVLLEFSTEPSQLLFSSCTFLFSLCSLFLFSLSFKGAIWCLSVLRIMANKTPFQRSKIIRNLTFCIFFIFRDTSFTKLIRRGFGLEDFLSGWNSGFTYFTR